LGLFLLSVILARNPGVPSDAVLTCMRLNANAQLQK
ncbi:plasmid transfer protein, partial [Klebsiella grimontii]|nr:plasmid transfer protein [Klebsiella grimontii]